MARTLTLTFIDTHRRTVSRGRLISLSRSLPTSIWLPAGAGPFPLIVFAHGYRLGIGPYRRLCQAWADAGFVVAAPSFPLTDASVAGRDLDESDIANQPGDIRFVTDQLISSSATPDSPITGTIDASRIALAGHSDGAVTVLAVTYLPADHDPRIRAVIAVAANPFRGVPATSPIVSTVPLLIVHSDTDEIVPYSRSQQLVRQIRAPGWFLELHGASHLLPLEGPSRWTPTVDAVTRDFLRAVFSGSPEGGPSLQSDSNADQGASTLSALS